MPSVEEGNAKKKNKCVLRGFMLIGFKEAVWPEKKRTRNNNVSSFEFTLPMLLCVTFFAR